MHRSVPGVTALAGLVLISVASCSSPTDGPAVRITEDGWTVDPVTTVQSGEWFQFTVTNELDVAVPFVVVQMDYGDVVDLPLVNGTVDVTRQVLYESEDPTVQSPPVVAYYVVHPGVEREGAEGWEPETLPAGEAASVQVGNPGLGGGEPGRFAVISHEPGGLEAGHYAVFDMTDENGEVPQFTLEDFYPPPEEEPDP